MTVFSERVQLRTRSLQGPKTLKLPQPLPKDGYPRCKSWMAVLPGTTLSIRLAPPSLLKSRQTSLEPVSLSWGPPFRRVFTCFSRVPRRWRLPVAALSLLFVEVKWPKKRPRLLSQIK